MSNFRTLDDVIVHGKRVLVRVDMNVPIIGGVMTDNTRLRRILPTVQELIAKKARIILVSHFGRPKGKIVPQMSLAPVAKFFERLLGQKIHFCEDTIHQEAQTAVGNLQDGDVLLIENIRFEAGEEKNSIDTARGLANLADIYVNDAFSAAHRAHASTEAITQFLPAVVGRGMQAELEALHKALSAPNRPVAAVVGGAKVSSKIALLENLIEKVDMLVIGGGMANTFLAARGMNVGKSLYEKDFIATAKRIDERALSLGVQIILPVDVVVAKDFKAYAHHRVCCVKDVADDEMILDIGTETVILLKQALASMKTVVWNGPLGAFELEPFDKGTVEVARIVAELTQRHIVTSVAGGGDTISALNHAGVVDKFGYISTAGGAFLEWMEGKSLPSVMALSSHIAA